MALRPISLTRQSGQASVELVATLPLVLLIALVAWQVALTGETLWLCANAARAAARATAVGRDAAAAARSALPAALERGLRVSRAGSGAVRVEVRMRTSLPVVASAGLPGSGS